MAHLLAQLLAALALSIAAGCRSQPTAGDAPPVAGSPAAMRGGAAGTESDRPASAGMLATPEGAGAASATTLASCVDTTGAPPKAYVEWRLMGSWSDDGTSRYEGPAVVERSTSSELVLAVQQADLTGRSDEDAGTSAEVEPARCIIETSTNALPVLAAGLRVWLAEHVDLDTRSPEQLPRRQTDGRSLAVSTSEHGQLIVGAASVPAYAVLGRLSFAFPEVTCSRPGASCFEHGHELAYSLAVRGGDTPLRVDDGANGELISGDIAYDVSVLSARKSVGMGQYMCFDGSPDPRIWVQVQALPSDPVNAMFERP